MVEGGLDGFLFQLQYLHQRLLPLKNLAIVSPVIGVYTFRKKRED